MLAALAGDDHREGVEIDVVDVEVNGLGDSSAGAVEELDERTIPQPFGGLEVASEFDHRENILVRKGFGQSARDGGRTHVVRGVDLGHALQVREAVEGAHGYDHPSGTGRPECRRAVGRGVPQRRREVRDVIRSDRLDVQQIVLMAPLDVPGEVAPVGGHSVRRQPSLDGDVVEVAGYSVGQGCQASTSSIEVLAMPNASATAP